MRLRLFGDVGSQPKNHMSSTGEVTWLGMEYAIKVHFMQDTSLRTGSSCIVTDHHSNFRSSVEKGAFLGDYHD